MYLYNVSIIVEENNHTTLLEWIKKEWIPNIPNEAKLLKMLNSPHEGHTYCIQLIAHSEEEIQAFNEQYIQTLQQHIGLVHRDKAFLFDSIMQYVQD